MQERYNVSEAEVEKLHSVQNSKNAKTFGCLSPCNYALFIYLLLAVYSN